MKIYYQKVLACMLATLVCFSLVSCGDDKEDDTNIPDNNSETISESMLQKYKWITRDYAFHDYDDWMELTEDVLIYFFISDTEGYLRHIHKWIDSSGFDDEGNNIDNIYFTYKVNGNMVRITPYMRSDIRLSFDGTYLKDGSYYYQPVDISSSDRNQIAKYYGTTGSCSWHYDSGLKCLIISGDGPMADYAAGRQPWKNLSYSTVYIEESVKHIGNHAFSDNAGLTEVWIAHDEGSFQLVADNDNSFKSIGVEAFANTSIKKIGFPKCLETIGTGAFQGCKYLEYALFADDNNIKSIGDFAFKDTKLYNRTYSSERQKYFNRTLSLESSLEELGKYAYSGDIEKIEIGSNLKKISACAFVTSVTSGSLYINRGTPPSGDGVVTPYDEGWTLYVPKGCKSAYQKVAPWKNFKIITEDSNLEKGNDYIEQEEDKGEEDANGNLTFTVNSISFKMIKVEGGTFKMGAHSGEYRNSQSDYCDNLPLHDVTLDDFFIGQTEITQELWDIIMEEHPWYDNLSRWNNRKYPAYYISWNNCQRFIEKLNIITGKNFRLPTEAEWEYAARGGKKSKNYKYSGSNDINSVAWWGANGIYTTGNSENRPHEVGTKKPNELGLYDMSGNISEWCQDWYDKNYYSYSPKNNPCGPVAGEYKVKRGDSFSSFGESDSENACRHYGNPDKGPGSYTGLRLVIQP